MRKEQGRWTPGKEGRTGAQNENEETEYNTEKEGSSQLPAPERRTEFMETQRRELQRTAGRNTIVSRAVAAGHPSAGEWLQSG